jgi:hypothetical protein
MIVVESLIQGTDAWIRARLGVLTASQVSQLLTKTGKLSAQRTKLAYKLAGERVLGEPDDEFAGTYWTERGSDLEDQAGAYFSLQTGHDPVAVGFVYKDDWSYCGCSPDWLVKEKNEWTAGVEVKCPKRITHIGYMVEDADQYIQQVQFSLWVTGLPRWYFMSYYPGLKPVLREVLPDQKWQDAFDEHVPKFLAEVAAIKERLK